MEARSMGASIHTFALGEQMRPCAQVLHDKTDVPFTVLQRLTGLAGVDEFITELMRVSGAAVPHKYKRQRSQLQDAMLDAHFFIGGKRIVIGAEPDLLWALAMSLTELGARISAAITTTICSSKGVTGKRPSVLPARRVAGTHKTAKGKER